MSDNFLNEWHVSKLANICKPVSRPISLESFTTYRLVGVRWYGQGVHISRIATGLELKTNQFDLVKAGDLTYNKMWTSKGAFGKVQPAHDGAIVTSEYPLFRVDERVVDINFLVQIFKLPSFWKQAASLSRGSTSRTRLNPDDFLELRVFLPPLLEQYKIAAILHSIDETIARTETVVEYVNKVKRGIAEQLLIHRSESTNFKKTKSGQFLSEWPVVKLKNLGDISYGLTVNEQRRQAVERLPYLRVGNVYRGYLDLTELKEIGVLNGDRERYMLVPGDVLVVEGNADPNQIGRAALWRGEVAECLHQNHILRFRPDPEQVIPEYVMIYLNSRQGQAYFKLNAKTSSGLNTINSSVLGNISVAVPSFDEQRKIVKVVSEMDRRLNSEEVYKTCLEQVKCGLMQKLLSGEIRVTV